LLETAPDRCRRGLRPAAAGPRYLVLRHFWIDLVGPGQDAAFQVPDFAETGLAEERHCVRRALSAAAVRHDFARAVQFVHAARQIAQGYQVAADLADLVFVRL